MGTGSSSNNKIPTSNTISTLPENQITLITILTSIEKIFNFNETYESIIRKYSQMNLIKDFSSVIFFNNVNELIKVLIPYVNSKQSDFNRQIIDDVNNNSFIAFRYIVIFYYVLQYYRQNNTNIVLKKHTPYGSYTPVEIKGSMNKLIDYFYRDDKDEDTNTYKGDNNVYESLNIQEIINGIYDKTNSQDNKNAVLIGIKELVT